MTLTEHADVIQGTDQWHDQRRGLVTASVIDRLVAAKPLTGIDYECPECAATPGQPCMSKVKRDGDAGAPIKTVHTGRTVTATQTAAPPQLTPATGDDARGLTLLLVAERITGHTDPTYLSDAMLRGIEDEPRALEVYAAHYAPVRTTGILIREEPGWRLGYSPDGLVGDDGLVEVKSRAQKKQLLTILEDTVPPENMAQLQAGLLVSGRAWIDYVSFCGGMPLYVKRVTPDPRWFRALTAAVELFEVNAARIVADYEVKVAGRPVTERAVELEMIL